MRSTPSTAANCRMTAIWQLCGGCGSNAAGGRWRVRPISTPGSRSCEKKAGLRRLYRYRARVIEQEIERIARQQEKERERQKKLEKSYEDFMKLLTFVQLVEEDDFWRSEVVQITARTASSGALELELTPRSGRFAILFGRPEDAERKFDKLLRFYRSGLSSVGWDAYRTVDVRYRNQVVCKK